MSATARRVLFLLVLLGLSSRAQADDSAPAPKWSPAVHGLRARLFTTPSHEPMLDKTFDLWIEFQEVGLDTSLGFQHRSLTVRFSRPEMQISVGAERSDPISMTPRMGDAPVFTWDLVFPPGGDISFPVAQGGSRPHVILGRTPPKGRLLSFDARGEWMIPAEGGPYQLAVTFVVAPDGEPPPVPAAPDPTGDATAATTNAAPAWVPSPSPEAADAAHKPPYHGWSGTLVLPPIDLPAQAPSG